MDCNIPGFRVLDYLLEFAQTNHGEGNGNPLQYSCLKNAVDRGTWWAAVHSVTQSRTQRSNLACVHALEKETATHSNILAWRIPGTGELGGLPSMGFHRVRRDWGDLAAAAAAAAAACPLSQRCHPIMSSSFALFSSCPQSFPASRSFPMSQFFLSGGQSIGASASTSIPPMSIQGWFPLVLTGLISLLLIVYSECCRIHDLQRFSFGTRDQVWSLKRFCVAEFY